MVPDTLDIVRRVVNEHILITLRYQKSDRKNDSETCSWLSSYLISGDLPAGHLRLCRSRRLHSALTALEEHDAMAKRPSRYKN